MRITVTLIALFLLAGCASVKKPYVAPGVIEQSGASVYVSAYNQQIERQGVEHYCAQGECDNPPKMIKGHAPVYPERMRAAGISGQATISFQIERNGHTDKFKVTSASAPAFAKAAIQAIKNWRFSPATLQGKPVALTVCQNFPFKLR